MVAFLSFPSLTQEPIAAALKRSFDSMLAGALEDAAWDSDWAEPLAWKPAKRPRAESTRQPPRVTFAAPPPGSCWPSTAREQHAKHKEAGGQRRRQLQGQAEGRQEHGDKQVKHAKQNSLVHILAAPDSAMAPHPSVGRFDILEHDDRYELVTDAPGFGASDISVELKDGVLTISGKRETTKETKPAAAAGEERGDKQQQQQQPAGAKVWRRERVVQQFSRSFKLPDNAKPDDIAAHLDKGVLSVHVPKLPPAPKPQPKRIMVQSAPAHAA